MNKAFYTTFEVAQICGVTMVGVIRWVNEGKLNAYKTPGGHRRILAQNLAQFLKRYGMPVPPGLADKAQSGVLVVDDDTAILSSITRTLKKMSLALEIKTAEDGFEAGQKAVEFRPDLVILDIFLPGVDGFRVCQNLKGSWPQIKILAITGKSSPEVQTRIKACGADGFLAKPFEMADLMVEVRRLLNVGVQTLPLARGLK